MTDHPGLTELVAVMDRLRSPGGCPWDAEQTHETLLPYAVEEVYEVVEAVEAGDRAGLREELGDLLLQVVFHARVAQEHPEDPFDVDDVAADVAAKLRRRHPHVFGGAGAPADGPTDADAVHRRWEVLKQAEKARGSVVDGIPPALPALARAQKVLGRVHRAGLDHVVADVEPGPGATGAPGGAGPAAELGGRLLALTAEAHALGVDAEAALRTAVRGLEDAVRRAEQDA